MTFGSTFGRVLSPTFQPKSQAAASSASTWWLAGGISSTDCLAAYRAKGAASLAASKADLSGNGYDIDGGSDPSFDTSTGWYFNGTSNYLFASDVAVYNGDFTVAVFANPLINHNLSSAMFSVNPINVTAAQKGFLFKSEQYNNTGKLGYTQRSVADYTSSIDTPSSNSVMMCTKSGTAVNIYAGASSSSITVSDSYRNVVTTGVLIGATYGSNSAPADYYKNYIYAIAYYKKVLTSDERSALMTAMAAL
jgi:hypothetical protein